MPGSTASGIAFHFDAIAAPMAAPAMARRQRAVSFSRTAPAHIHNPTSTNASMKISSMAMRAWTSSGNPVTRNSPVSKLAARLPPANHRARIPA